MNNIFLAVISGSLQHLASFPHDKINERDPAGDTPLHYAASHKNILLVRYLVSNGADVNATNDIGSTPLHKAALAQSEIVIDHLLENKAESIPNKAGFSPSDYCRENKAIFLKLLNKEKAIEDKIEVFFGNLPRIIGKKGATIDSIRCETGTIANAPFEKDLPKESLISIQLTARTKDNIEAAKTMIKSFDHNVLLDPVVGFQKIQDVQYSGYSTTIQVPKKKHAKIIGKDRVNVNKIEEDSGAAVIFPKDKSDTITIQGDPRECAKAKSAIMKLVRESDAANYKAEIIEKKISIPRNHHSTIIGKGGQTINRLKSEFGVQIHIPPQGAGDFITIRGDSAAVSAAITEIHTVVSRSDSYQGKREKKYEKPDPRPVSVPKSSSKTSNQKLEDLTAWPELGKK